MMFAKFAKKKKHAQLEQMKYAWKSLTMHLHFPPAEEGLLSLFFVSIYGIF